MATYQTRMIIIEVPFCRSRFQNGIHWDTHLIETKLKFIKKSDIRNTQVPSLKSMLEQNGVKVDIYDPNVKPEVAKNSFGIELLKKLPVFDNYHLIVSPYDLSIKKGGRF